MEEYVPDTINIVDEEGNEYLFEELDRIETDSGLYVALCHIPEAPEEIIEDAEEEFIVLKVVPGEGEEVTLEPIEDEEEYDEIGKIFLERFAQMFEEEDEN